MNYVLYLCVLFMYIHTLCITYHIIQHQNLCMTFSALLQSISSIMPILLEVVTYLLTVLCEEMYHPNEEQYKIYLKQIS